MISKFISSRKVSAPIENVCRVGVASLVENMHSSFFLLVYGYETWALRKRHDNSPRVFENTVLWSSGENWRGERDEELHARYVQANIS